MDELPENCRKAVPLSIPGADAYFTPETIEDYNYIDKDNREHYGKQFKFKMEFPQKKSKK